MRFSILIPTWNNLEFLKCCVASIRKNSSEEHEILVYVNEGADGTADWCRSEGIRFIHSKENVGVCTALNALFEISTQDIICYVNDDMYLCPNWDKPLVEEINSIGHEKFYLSSTMIEPEETGNKCVLAPFDFGRSPDNFKEHELLNALSEMSKPDWSGSTWPPNVMHRNMWKVIGGYGEEFSPGLYSDPDVSMKLWKQGVRVFKGLGESRSYHFMSKSTGRVRMNDGKKTFLKKWGVSSSWFVKNVLKQGQTWNGPLPDVDIKPNLKDKIKGLLS
ncbi:MAG: glycosyltransferase family 2 protein [Flavobacteriales bacterium]|nr:glycosyltransferase family 2 protein [Flavobacteriales bacterium]MCB9191674.1 glycosyltransferase family 2 protein [Flavobacteriales bacterium]MCB9203672.1 glycosyltransferase family 2 protein [Flavobacteriales bacterium]